MPYVLCDNQGLKDSVAQMPYIPCDNQLPISSSSPRQDTELQFVHILRWVIFFWQQLSLQTTRSLLSNSNSFISRVPTSNFLINWFKNIVQFPIHISKQQAMAISPVERKINQLGDHIISEIATSIIFGIAKDEGIIDHGYNSSVIDNLMKEFQFWNSQSNVQRHKTNRVFLGEDSHSVGVKKWDNKMCANQWLQLDQSDSFSSLPLEDDMGLESCIYQQVQKSTDSLLPQLSHSQLEAQLALVSTPTLQVSHESAPDIEERACEQQQVLSILQTPSQIMPIIKTPKSRGRPRRSNTKVEIAAGIQTTLDDTFGVTKRLTRRTKCSPCPQ